MYEMPDRPRQPLRDWVDDHEDHPLWLAMVFLSGFSVFVIIIGAIILAYT